MMNPKPYTLLVSEKRSHKTKAELKLRQSGESGLLSGIKIKEKPEVRDNPDAHKEFLRISGLLKRIEKNDDLYEGIVNRYAQLYSECLDFSVKREASYLGIERLKQDYNDQKLEASEYYGLIVKLGNQLILYDKQIQAKRDMMLKIEKETVMTPAAALRSIPKKVEEKADDDPMAALLQRRG